MAKNIDPQLAAIGIHVNAVSGPRAGADAPHGGGL